MRNVDRIRLGYYPLPEEEMRRLRNLECPANFVLVRNIRNWEKLEMARGKRYQPASEPAFTD
jgi:hypothetical protein